MWVEPGRTEDDEEDEQEADDHIGVEVCDGGCLGHVLLDDVLEADRR